MTLYCIILCYAVYYGVVLRDVMRCDIMLCYVIWSNVERDDII